MGLLLALILLQNIGVLTGGEFAIHGSVQFGRDGKPMLVSGSEIEVRSGTVTLALEGGGTVRFCGAMKATVLKGQGLLLALDTGAVEMESGGEADAIETPFYRVTGAGHSALSITPEGRVCVRATAGTVRVSEQFGSGQLVLPPGKAMSLTADGGVNAAEPVPPESCGCKPQPPVPSPPTPNSSPIPQPPTQTTLAVPLVFRAEEMPAGKPAEPQVTLPVVVSDPQAPKPSPKEVRPPKRGFGARLRAFFRAVFVGGRRKPSQSPAASPDAKRMR